MEITPKTPWKIERSIKQGSVKDRKFCADLVRIKRNHDSNIREIEKSMEHNALMMAVCMVFAMMMVIGFAYKQNSKEAIIKRSIHSMTATQWETLRQLHINCPNYNDIGNGCEK